jgi:acyl-[acyl-carrier-protein]-phospholipid O-acyltransferase/long-chain-fatty-acid--[acyl-carrier-protein] ligase
MLRLVVRAVLAILYRLEVRGRPPRAERLLFVANHQSLLDVPVLWLLLPRDTVWIVHAQVLQLAVFRWVLKHAEHRIIDALNPIALRAAVELVEAGRPVIIFPEGRVTVTGTMMKVYDGAALVAARARASIAPVWIDGAVHARGFTRVGGGFTVKWFPKVRVTFHPLRSFPLPDAPTGRLRRRRAGDALLRLLQEARVASQPPQPLHDAFLGAVAFHGRGRAMIEDSTGARMNYGLMLRASLALGRLASRLSDENEPVGVMMPNSCATLCLIFGLLGMRRVVAMINFTSGVEGVQGAIRAAGIRTILTSRAFLERARLQPLVDRLEGVRVVCLEDLRPTFTLADKLWLLLYALRFPRAATLRSRPEEPAAVLFTSGSEGKPKGVVLSHAAILANVGQMLAVEDLTAADRLMSAMPVFHSFGLTCGFILPAITGTRAFLYPSPLHYNIIPELIYDRDCTVMFATNTFLRFYGLRAHPYDFRRLRLIISGAEKLTDEVRRLYADKFGARIIEGYGATECSPVIAANSPMKCMFGSVGTLLPAMEYRLEPVPGIGEGGLLHVRGPNLMLGYWRESAPRVLEFPASPYGPGWYATGDLARFDDDGFLFLLGRLRRFAKTAGEMISLDLPERLAESVSPAKMHAALARPDPARGEVILLCTTDAGLRRDQLQHAARDLGFPELAVPRRILPVEKIPLLGNGKKDYPALQRLVETQIESTE